MRMARHTQKHGTNLKCMTGISRCWRKISQCPPFFVASLRRSKKLFASCKRHRKNGGHHSRQRKARAVFLKIRTYVLRENWLTSWTEKFGCRKSSGLGGSREFH